jgi:hypothetical protein
MPPISEWLGFFHANGFDGDWEGLDLTDEDLARLQQVLVDDPEAGDVIKGTGGLRKVRFAPPGSGKSGGARVCYAHFPDYGLILLVMAYGKSRTADLTPAQKKAIAKQLEGFADWLGQLRTRQEGG